MISSKKVEVKPEPLAPTSEPEEKIEQDPPEKIGGNEEMPLLQGKTF